MRQTGEIKKLTKLFILFYLLSILLDDFKPASVDPSKKATMELGQNNQVTVIAPSADGSGHSNEKVFKGSRKPYLKECVLVIDHDTGEITLERLSQNFTVKKTRAEGSSRVNSLAARPSTPSSIETNGKRSPPRGKHAKAPGRPQTSGQASSSSQRQHSPTSSSAVSHATPNSSTSAIPSNHSIDDVTMRSLSSSSESDSDDDSSSSDDDEAARKLESTMASMTDEPPAVSNSQANGSSPKSAKSDDDNDSSSSDDDSSSSSSSDDDDADNDVSKPSPAASSNGHSNGSLSMPSINAFSMPSFSQMSGNGGGGSSTKAAVTAADDLRLSSESDSDSD